MESIKDLTVIDGRDRLIMKFERETGWWNKYVYRVDLILPIDKVPDNFGIVSSHPTVSELLKTEFWIQLR